MLIAILIFISSCAVIYFSWNDEEARQKAARQQMLSRMTGDKFPHL